ncbi:MAG: LytTR family DNA-binding domain-containing protein [Rhodothermales bacterium]
MALRCLIVDDEPLAHRVIQRYAADLPALEIMGKAMSALEAGEILQQQAVDLMFLDINMPRLSGMSFLRALRQPPLVIVTTAYQEYALEGYELDIVDYLKKPYSFERFYAAIQKAQDRMQRRTADGFVLSDTRRTQIDEAFVFVKADKRTVRVNLKDLLYVEAVGDYVKYHTTEGVIMSYQTLKSIEQVLPANHFPRIHKSHLVALSKVQAVEGHTVEIDRATLPIGKTYHPAFMELIQSFAS